MTEKTMSEKMEKYIQDKQAEENGWGAFGVFLIVGFFSWLACAWLLDLMGCGIQVMAWGGFFGGAYVGLVAARKFYLRADREANYNVEKESQSKSDATDDVHSDEDITEDDLIF